MPFFPKGKQPNYAIFCSKKETWYTTLFSYIMRKPTLHIVIWSHGLSLLLFSFLHRSYCFGMNCDWNLNSSDWWNNELLSLWYNSRMISCRQHFIRPNYSIKLKWLILFDQHIQQKFMTYALMSKFFVYKNPIFGRYDTFCFSFESKYLCGCVSMYVCGSCFVFIFYSLQNNKQQ